MCTSGPTQLISIREEIFFGFKAFLLVDTILFIELKALLHSIDDIATVLIAVNNGNDMVGGGRGTSFSIIIYMEDVPYLRAN